MKVKTYYLAALLLATCFSPTMAQDDGQKKEKIKIKILEDVNGERKLVERTYSSKEEMMSDPELKRFDVKFLTDGNDLSIENKDGKHVIIRSFFEEGESIGDIDWEHDFDHNQVDVFIQDCEGEPQVHVLGDGEHDVKIHKLQDGEESKIEVGENVFEFKKTEDGKMEIFKNGELLDTEFSDLHDKEGNVFMIKSSDDGVVKHFVHEVRIRKIHVEEINKKDPELKELELDQKKLNLDGLSYYPNPSDGELNLAFKADAKPTEIRLTNINGKIVHREILSDFEGSYDQTIDLSNQPSGIYLLQVIQADRAMNKKLIIE